MGPSLFLVWQDRLGSAWFLKTLGPETPFGMAEGVLGGFKAHGKEFDFLGGFHQTLGRECVGEIFFSFDKQDLAMR